MLNEERDVIRCDRSHQFYKGTTSNLEKLKALLLTYTMYDFDTGYVQGINHFFMIYKFLYFFK